MNGHVGTGREHGGLEGGNDVELQESFGGERLGGEETKESWQ